MDRLSRLRFSHSPESNALRADEEMGLSGMRISFKKPQPVIGSDMRVSVSLDHLADCLQGLKAAREDTSSGAAGQRFSDSRDGNGSDWIGMD